MYKVIIAITTFNLENYISQALDSVLMQETNFEFKIIVGDDCSSDKTQDILKEYKQKYPNKIDVLFSSKNMGSLANSNRLLDKIDSEYFCFLDGDDYWIDNKRLQRQVDFMDSHKEYSMCGGDTQFLRNGELAETMLDKKMLGRTLSFNNLVNGEMPVIIHTSTILFRNIIFKDGLPPCFKEAVGTKEECALRGEDFRRILHLERGPIYVENEVLSVYRIHDKGIWQGKTPLRRYLEIAVTFNFYYKYFGDKYGDYFFKLHQRTYNSLMVYLIANKLLIEYNKLSPDDGSMLAFLISDLSSRNKDNKNYKSKKLRYYFWSVVSKIFHAL